MKKQLIFLIMLVALSVLSMEAEQKLYFSNFPRKTPTKSLEDYLLITRCSAGIHLRWTNHKQTMELAQASEFHYIEDLQKITIAATVKKSSGVRYFIEFLDSENGRWQAEFFLTPTADMQQLTIVPEKFKRIQRGADAGSPQRPGQEILKTTLLIKGLPGAELDLILHDFRLQGSVQEISLFKADGTSTEIYEQSKRYRPAPEFPVLKHNKPRVIVAENSRLAGSEKFQRALIDMAKLFPGQFGVHFNGILFPRLAKVSNFFRSHDIQTSFEAHNTQNMENWATNQKMFLTRDDGFTMNDPANWTKSADRSLWPAHGLDITQQEAFLPMRNMIEAAAKNGMSEFLMIDYIWPWKGRWGYGQKTVEKFRADLAEQDCGLWLADSPGNYRHYFFWDYLRLFSDVKLTPEMLGIKSWYDYFPVTEKQAAAGGKAEKCNLYCYYALYHYEYLKFLQKCAEEMSSHGIRCVAGSNREDLPNGCDHYWVSRLKGVAKNGYCFFPEFQQTYAWYHNMRFYSNNSMKYLGKGLYCIAEIGPGGHGHSELDLFGAYAFYYDVTATAFPCDYNNQYLETAWNGKMPASPRQQERFGHWMAGAYAFLQRHQEADGLPPAKSTVLIASRNQLELQGGFSSTFRQTNNLAQWLDELHYPFDSAGKEGLHDGFCDDAEVMIYCPSESSPMHFDAVKLFLNQKPGRTVITHSRVPVTISSGAVSMKRGTIAINYEKDPVYSNYFDHDAFKTSRKLLLSDLGEPVQKIIKFQGHSVSRTFYPAPGGNVVLRADDGSPLVSEFQSGKGRILYCHVDFPFDPSDTFNRTLCDAVMRLAGQKPEAYSTRDTGIHIYPVPGGNSAVVYDSASIPAMRKLPKYVRTPLTNPSSIEFAVADGQYKVYRFFEDDVQEVTAQNGLLSVAFGHSVDLFYFGRSDDAQFTHTLQQIKKVRNQLRELDPHVLVDKIRREGYELLKNPGFEQSQNQHPTEWTTFFPHRYLLSDGNVRSGKAAFALLPAKKGGSRIFLQKRLPASSEASYLLSAWVKTTGLSANDFVQLRVEFYSKGKYNHMVASSKLTGNGDWRQLELLFHIPNEIDDFNILLVLDPAGGQLSVSQNACAIFDDISLLKYENKK